MNRRLRWATPVAMVVAIALTAAPAAAATDVTVDDDSFRFTPERVTRAAGTTVTWHKSDGFHNVSSTQGMFRSGDATSSAFTFTRTFSAGTFAYLCEVHPSQMRGTVRIRPRVRSGPDGAAFAVVWATPATNTGREFTVQFRVGDGRWRIWKRETSARRGAFGADGSPIQVRPGQVYRFRVKSHRGDNASSFSPVRKVTP